MSKLRVLAWISAAFCVATLAALLLQPIERHLDDARVTLLPDSGWPSDLVLVTIDDESIRRIGRWPWARDRDAELITRLHALGAKTIAVDVTFGAHAGEAEDRALTEALRLAIVPVALASSTTETSPAGLRLWPPTAALSLPPEALVMPVEPFASAAAGLGHIVSFPDGDGVLRRHLPFLGVVGKEGALPSLALAAWTSQHDRDPGEVKLEPGRLVLPGGRRLRLSEEGSFSLDFSGEDPPAIPAWKILAGNTAGTAALAGKLALVYVDSLYAPDLVSVPGRSKVPGGLLVARQLRTLDQGRVPVRPPLALLLALLAVPAFLGAGPLAQRGTESVVAWTLAVAVLLVGLDLALTRAAGILLPVLSPLVFLGTMGALSLALSSREEAAERKKLKALLSGAREALASVSAGSATRPLSQGSLRTDGNLQIDDRGMLVQPVEVGRYLVQQAIGRGGMGAIFLALDRTLQRKVALKVLEAADAEAFARFRTEAQAVARLSHPNVVQIYDVGLDAEVPFIAMEYLAGGTVWQLAQREVRLDWRRSARIIAGLARGLGAAHAQGIVHRDVKPGNLLLTDPEGDTAKVADFGIAKLTGMERLTREGSFVGTIGYLSPEQGLGMEVDARSDVYSLAATWFRLLTGERAFAGSNAEILRLQVTRPLPDPVAFRPGLPRELGGLVARMGALDRADRPRNGNAAAAEIEELLAYLSSPAAMP